VLCAVDFSAPSLAAVRHALGLTAEAGATLCLLHVIEWLVEDEPGTRIAGFDVPEYRRYLEKDARERLAALLPAHAAARPVDALIAGGRPWREILRFVEERHVDLVVMGVRGRSAVDLALFGSTTHHVVRAAACPVLVVHTN
jgi:nucleotide-binding universal stress UspA family protein